MMPADMAKHTSRDMLGAIALAVHRIVGNMPVAIKFQGGPGIMVDDGMVVDCGYESGELERSIARPDKTRIRLSQGRHAGREMYASTITYENSSHIVGATGVIDTAGVLKLKELAERHVALNNQVAGGFFEIINGENERQR
jgi:hypothetical protein